MTSPNTDAVLAADVSSETVDTRRVDAYDEFVPRRSLALEAKIGFFVVMIFSLTALFWPQSDEVEAPTGLLVDVTGEEVRVENVMTPVTLVHFWSTWCPPCLTETPSIQRMAKDFSDDGQFSLLMVAVADDVKKATDFLGGPQLVGYFDHDWKLAKRYGTDKLPETHLVVNGEVVESFIGVTDWDSAEVRQKISAALTAAAALTSTRG